jgi:hypothetical protein
VTIVLHWALATSITRAYNCPATTHIVPPLFVSPAKQCYRNGETALGITRLHCDVPLDNTFKRHEALRFLIMVSVQAQHNDYLKVGESATPGNVKLQDAFECAFEELPSIEYSDLPAIAEVLRLALRALEVAQTRMAQRGETFEQHGNRPSNLFSLNLVPLEAQGAQAEGTHN